MQFIVSKRLCCISQKNHEQLGDGQELRPKESEQ